MGASGRIADQHSELVDNAYIEERCDLPELASETWVMPERPWSDSLALVGRAAADAADGSI